MADQNLSYAIRLDSSGFQRGLRSATQSLSAFRIGLANALVSKGFSLLQNAVTRFAAAFRSSLDLGSELTHLSAETGVTVSDLLVLRQAFQDCGVPASALSTSVAYMNRALSGVSETGQRTEGVFAALGLDLGALRKMSPADAFETIGRAIGSLGNAADRSAAAVAIFGRSGSALNRVFSNPNAIRQARDALGSMPAIMSLNASTAEAWQTSMGRFQTQIQGGVMGALSGLLPVLDEISDKVASIDFTEIGLNIGAYLQQLWQGGLTGLFDELVARCNVLGVAVWEAIRMAFSPLLKGETWSSLGPLIGGELLKACAWLSKGFTSCVAVFTAGILKAVDSAKEKLSELPGINLKSSGKTFGQHFDDTMQSLSGTYQPAMDMANDLIQQGKAGSAKAWSGAFDGWGEAVQNSSGTQYLEAMKQEREAWKNLFLQRGKAAEQEAKAASAPTGGGQGGGGGGDTKKAASATSLPSSDQWARIGAFAGGGAQSETLRIQRGSYDALKAIAKMTTRIQGHFLQPATTTL